MTDSFALVFVLDRHGVFKFVKGNTLLSCLGEAMGMNRIPISLSLQV